MLSLMRTSGRGVAAGLAGVLVAGATALVAAPAQADAAQAAPATGELTWNISEQYVSHLSSRTLAGGAAFDEAAKTFSFPSSGVSTAPDGTVTSSFGGSVRGAFGFGGTEFYSVTVAAPTVVVEADGDGYVTATVSSANAATERGAAAQTDPRRVKVAEFSRATTTSGMTTATPDWEGVIATGSPQAVALGITSPAQPALGKSFHPELLGNLVPGVRAHFYYSTSGDHKRPGAFSYAAAAKPTVTATVVAASAADGISITAQGAGFTAVTNPGDAGVYVALAPADTVIDFDDRSSMSSMASVDYVTPDRFRGAEFTAVLNAPTEKLQIGEPYAIFTWQAHTHSSTSQDTRTLVDIDWSKFVKAPVAKKAAKTTLKITKQAHRKRAGKATVAVTGKAGRATGRVKVSIKVAGVKKARTVTVALNRDGKAVFKLPKAKKKGRYKVIVKYAGDARYQAGKNVVKKFKVRK